MQTPMSVFMIYTLSIGPPIWIFPPSLLSTYLFHRTWSLHSSESIVVLMLKFISSPQYMFLLCIKPHNYVCYILEIYRNCWNKANAHGAFADWQIIYIILFDQTDYAMNTGLSDAYMIAFRP